MYKGVNHAIYNERQLLEGNLNRMTITDSDEELQTMFGFAINRVVTMRNLNMQRLQEKELDAKS